MSKVFHVLLSGGVGSRLWPLSRQSKPKQYLEIFEGNSLFELAVKRNSGLTEGLIVVGNKDNKNLSEKILAKSPSFPYIAISEAASRNTAPAVAFAAFYCDPDDVLLVTPADHIIKEGRNYDEAIKQAVDLAKKNFLVTFGISPKKPETGYGYIEHSGDKVISFHEKPAREKAEEFLQKGNFLWNSGMFCFKAGVYLQELRTYQPKILKRSLIAWEKSQNGEMEFSTSMDIPSMSIDYAVMEHSKKLKVVKSDFEWSDMGSFESVYEYLKNTGYFTDTNNNMQIGDCKPTFFVGVNNCILISTQDANLVVSKEASQDVKMIYQYLEKNHPELLH